MSPDRRRKQEKNNRTSDEQSESERGEGEGRLKNGSRKKNKGKTEEKLQPNRSSEFCQFLYEVLISIFMVQKLTSCIFHQTIIRVNFGSWSSPFILSHLHTY